MEWKRLSEGWIPTQRKACKNGCEKPNWRFYMKPGNLIKTVCRACESENGFLSRSWLIHHEGC